MLSDWLRAGSSSGKMPRDVATRAGPNPERAANSEDAPARVLPWSDMQQQPSWSHPGQVHASKRTRRRAGLRPITFEAHWCHALVSCMNQQAAYRFRQHSSGATHFPAQAQAALHFR